MKATPLLSILIPAYNADKTIERCLDSILSQKTDAYEVVIVDDGSKDTTYSVLEKFVSTERITVIHQENRGVSSTRQRLIENAKGKYILFCDADDFLEPNALVTIVELIKKNDSSDQNKIDLYIFGYNLIRTSVNKTVRCKELKTGIYTKDQYARYHTAGFNDLYYSALWNKCFRKEIVFSPTEILFEKLIEDVMFNIDYVGRCDKIYISDQVIYNYNQIGESLTRSNKSDSEKDIIDALNAYMMLRIKALKAYPDYSIAVNQDICYRLYLLKKRTQVIQCNNIEIMIQHYMREYKKQLGKYYLLMKTNITFNRIKMIIKKTIKKRWIS